jgi:hypothetical protein
VAEKNAVRIEESEPGLQSTKEVIGYDIQATDGEIGDVEDFIVDDETWTIRYIVVDTQKWLPGKKVLVFPIFIEQMDWVETKIYVNLTQEKIEHAPPFNPQIPMLRANEAYIYEYYDLPKYWL